MIASLTTVNQAQFVPSDAATAAKAAGDTTTLLPEPSPRADIGLVIAKMVIENAFNSRKQARQDREHATKAMVAAQDAQVSKMREMAEKRYEAAQTEAYGKMAEGALGVLGGFATAGGFSKNDTQLKAQTNSGLGEVIGSQGKVLGGVMSLASAGDKRAADRLDADAKAFENEATQHKRTIEDADDDAKEARELSRTALDFLREFESTQTKSMSSAIKA